MYCVFKMTLLNFSIQLDINIRICNIAGKDDGAISSVIHPYGNVSLGEWEGLTINLPFSIDGHCNRFTSLLRIRIRTLTHILTDN